MQEARMEKEQDETAEVHWHQMECSFKGGIKDLFILRAMRLH